MDEAEEVFDVVLPSGDESSEVLHPAKGPVDFPSSAIAAELAAILGEFYNSVSAVIGGHVESEFQESFVDLLAGCIHGRNLSRTALDRRTTVILLDQSTIEINSGEIRALTEILRQELASLDVLISNFKSQIKLHR